MNELQANSHIAYIIPSAIGFALGAATLGWQRLSHLGAISITYWVLFATYIIRPLITYVIEQDFSQIQHLSDHYCDTTTPLATHFTTGFVVSCYILAFTITAARLQKPPSKQTPSTTRLSMASMKNAHIAAALLISTGYLVLLFGRVSAGTLTRTTGGAVWSGTTGYLFMLSHLVSLGSLLLIRTRRRFLLAGAVATPYLITLFASGYNRMFFMTYALAAIVLLLDLKLQQKAASNNRGSWASRLGRLPWLRLGLTAFTILIVFNMLGRSRGSLMLE